MKKIYHALFVFVFLCSCVNEGEIGPQGEKGVQGQPGKDGSAVLNGTTDPIPKLGNVGDFYINTSSYLLFGPKTDTGWEDVQSVLGAKGDKGEKGDHGDKGDKGDQGNQGDKGDKGEKGETGHAILRGSSNPTPDSGSAGDFYYNTNTRTLYFRTDSGWELMARMANTIQFTKPDVNLGSPLPYVVRTHLPFPVLERSMVHVYVALNRPGRGHSWHPLPGYLDSFNSFRVEFYGLSTFTNVSIHRVTGSNWFPSCAIRIVVTEADQFEAAYRVVDFNDYDAVSEYFDLDAKNTVFVPN